ncbi:MAG: LemA family protein [Bacteroidota bacterium]|nr:LemA family protein [Bacteroidota bacterium]MDX5429154.1 LemA family protein [Bacteroidota bacterium]MDX5448480.1 LemA family protein [Bacteroidota bacterium]MDX5506792.1 LemA family protein [Bacteroidota bacterium]
MKRGTIIAIIIVVLLVMMGGCGVSRYNKMVDMEVRTEQQWANVESAYQRRADLIPNLVNTVKGYADFEQETLTRVIEARAKATSVTLSPDNLSPENIQKFEAAQGELSSALSRLLVTVERYPDLKANQNFLQLQNQLEGTENRINVERNRFNEVVGNYNAFIRKFPNSLIAGLGGFDKKGFFEASSGAENAPKVEF